MIERLGNGVYRQSRQMIHKLGKPFKSPERQMKSGSGWYTLFGDHWCWLFKKKGKYTATIEGIGDTPAAEDIEVLERLVRNEVTTNKEETAACATNPTAQKKTR